MQMEVIFTPLSELHDRDSHKVVGKELDGGNQKQWRLDFGSPSFVSRINGMTEEEAKLAPAAVPLKVGSASSSLRACLLIQNLHEIHEKGTAPSSGCVSKTRMEPYSWMGESIPAI